MTTKKDLIIAVLSTFCITVTLFMILPTNSIAPYDPWADINDDGKLDMQDIWYEAKLYGALGDPTKSVVINGYGYNVSTYDINVPAQTKGKMNITTEGCKQVTVAFDANISQLQECIEIRTGFLLTNFYGYIDSFTLPLTKSTSPVFHPPKSIWIEPSNINIIKPQLGQKFNVTVWAGEIPSNNMFQVGMYFNDDFLEVTRWFEPTWDPNYIYYGKYTDRGGFVRHLAPGMGEVSFGAYHFATPAFCEVGKLCIFELNITHTPETGELSSPLYIDNNSTVFMHDLTMIEGVTKYSATVQLGSPYMVKTYTVTGPILTIEYNNPNEKDIVLKIEVYLTA